VRTFVAKKYGLGSVEAEDIAEAVMKLNAKAMLQGIIGSVDDLLRDQDVAEMGYSFIEKGREK